MTDVSLDTVTVAGGGAVARTLRSMASDVANVKSFGAVGDGASDDTAAIQAAVNSLGAGGVVFFPAGTYRVSSAINSTVRGIVFSGSGSQGSILSTSSATADVLTISGWDSGVEGLGFASSVTRTAGSFVVLTGAFGHIEKCRFDGHYCAININSPAAPISVRDCIFHNATPASTSPGGGGVWINVPGTDVRLDGLIFINDTVASPTYGINVVAVGALMLDNSDIVGQGTALLVNSGSGSTAQAIFATNTYFDTCTGNCVTIQPAAGGNVLWVKFTNVWASPASGGGNGIFIDGSSGVVADVNISSFVVHNDYGPSQSGILFQGAHVKNVSISNGMCAGFVYGVVAGPGVCDFTITGVTAGAYDPTTQPNNYGIVVSTGASDRYIISGNRAYGNLIKNLVDNGTGTNKVVQLNLAP
ncbi:MULTISPECIES: glycosyl hydrolase family 28-related protein [Burkholderia cepacia complex]|uniref:Rhamnogalacturonase A/B/Epimerase-like pectate lyase domain-containing protein n=1 Tax=Burkholderia orbicola (strain MC0-3) TaxID=406425 RepID=B1JWA8_BURO0|nr:MULTISPECIES: glycosyl hydrolase family 28-related protein [Burkholderia cepacia complex]ACA91545.1 hypothetical protein Bcenmc03_2384 [Burkholderia orbicola MC0-3]